ncbi:hypothetical protein AMK15_27820 [Streptomyces sp. MJM1172]|nr:hypothetical protein AMK15_27820 [Streptomyces sp. MJM1172]
MSFRDAAAFAPESASRQAHREALIPAELYEDWGPLASLLYGHSPGSRKSLMYAKCTRLMRASRFSLGARLRQLLAERGLTISTTVLAYLFPDGPETETGVVCRTGVASTGSTSCTTG